MDARRVLLIFALAALVASAAAFSCQDYNGKQAGARCHTPEFGKGCCVGPLWCDKGRCSARSVGDDEKLRACQKFAQQAGDRCDINNGLCCDSGKGLRCNVGRCAKN